MRGMQGLARVEHDSFDLSKIPSRNVSKDWSNSCLVQIDACQDRAFSVISVAALLCFVFLEINSVPLGTASLFVSVFVLGNIYRALVCFHFFQNNNVFSFVLAVGLFFILYFCFDFFRFCSCTCFLLTSLWIFVPQPGSAPPLNAPFFKKRKTFISIPQIVEN